MPDPAQPWDPACDCRRVCGRPGIPGAEERRLELQIPIGLLTDAGGFPLLVEAFEGDRAEITTILPMIGAFMVAHRPADIAVVADARMISDGSRGPPGSIDRPRDQVIYDKHKADRARRTLHGIDEQVGKAEKPSREGAGQTQPVHPPRRRGQEREANLEAKARTLAGWKGARPTYPARVLSSAIRSYRSLLKIKKSFRTPARPGRPPDPPPQKRASIGARLTIVFAPRGSSRTGSAGRSASSCTPPAATAPSRSCPARSWTQPRRGHIGRPGGAFFEVPGFSLPLPVQGCPAGLRLRPVPARVAWRSWLGSDTSQGTDQIHRMALPMLRVGERYDHQPALCSLGRQ